MSDSARRPAQWRVIGIDCSTDPKSVGLALVVEEQHGFVLKEARTGREKSPLEQVLEWIGENDSVLLALDAPLGWPAAMAERLVTHEAGQEIAVDANDLFRRETDRFVYRATNKTPLDIGADRIARTAHWALSFLTRLRTALGRDIPLAWSLDLPAGVHAIEVYPAATLLGLGASLKGYKAGTGREERRVILDLLGRQLSCGELGNCIESADALDAAVCALAGVDFLLGKAHAPGDLALAKKEGWIWFAGGASHDLRQRV